MPLHTLRGQYKAIIGEPDVVIRKQQQFWESYIPFPHMWIWLCVMGWVTCPSHIFGFDWNGWWGHCFNNVIDFIKELPHHAVGIVNLSLKVKRMNFIHSSCFSTSHCFCSKTTSLLLFCDLSCFTKWQYLRLRIKLLEKEMSETNIITTCT